MRVKVGKYTYLYESESYRNENGEPRNNRKLIGKVDPATGKYIFKQEYLDRTTTDGKPSTTTDGQPSTTTDGKPIKAQPNGASFSEEDIRLSTVLNYGSFYLYKKLAEQMGLMTVLQEALPSCWKEVFNLASYLISTGDPFSYCEDWLERTDALPVGPMPSQRISELLAGIDQLDRDRFYHLWCSHRSESEYLALDITSTSSYSELIESVEWGYNRDGEKLPQINICLLMGFESRYPIYQSIYGGSLKDVTTLTTTIQTFQALAGEKQMIAVMDKGFFSAKNVNTMLSDKHHVDFIIAVPFTNKFAKELVKSEKKDIDTLKNTIVCGKESLRAITKVRSWNKEHKVYAHVYYNARKAHGIRENLFANVATLREQAMLQPEKYVNDRKYTKYLIIRRSEREASGYTVNLREDVVEVELETAGWMVVISNFMTDAKEAIRIYREKDIVEKGFCRLKNTLDMGRLRVHSEESTQNKLFVGFISLILLSGIHNVMVEQMLYRTMTMKKLIMTLSKLKVQFVKGVRILFPVTKAQRDIYKAFGIKVPM